MSLILDLAEIESYVISERTTKGIQLAKDDGRIGGRPRVSQTKIEIIRHLYKNKKYSLREIADECHVSLGTVHKYSQKVEKKEMVNGT